MFLLLLRINEKGGRKNLLIFTNQNYLSPSLLLQSYTPVLASARDRHF